ncbi:MAG: GNAT family N-acetyltransferase [Jatrophihabitans sp.]
MILTESVAVDALRSDGGQVHIRSTRPDDANLLRELVERCSDRCLYLRFFATARVSAETYMMSLAAAGNDDRRALVATIGSRAVAAAGYERISPTSAEVALLAEDAVQREGIGTLLLEHLISFARRSGITELVAIVLAENLTMIHALRSLGYPVEQSFQDGEVRMVCHLDPGPIVQDAVDERDRIADANSLRPILAPTSIAIVGASDRPRSVGRQLLESVLAGGFAGPVYPVNPRHERILGITAYPSVSALPRNLDLAVIAVPAGSVAAVVRTCGEQGIRGLLIVTSGFRESAGADGAALERHVVQIARQFGMRLVGPNCLGIVNTAPDVRLDATFSGMPMSAGGFGLASQSGALGIAVVRDAQSRGLGLSQFVSLGNKADVSGNDLLHWWASDPATKVIGLYLESFGNPRKFARIARKLSRTKPVIVIKSGRSEAGIRAGQSHTAAAASADHIVDALCAQAGVLRVDTVEQMIDAARLLERQPLPRGPRVAVIGNSGGPGILSADAAAAAGLAIPPLSTAVIAALRAASPSIANASNPIDLGGDMTGAALSAAIDVVLASDEVDAVHVVVAPTVAITAEEAELLVNRTGGEIPMLLTVLGDHLPRRPGTHGAVRFDFPEPAAHTVALAWRYAQLRAEPIGTVTRPEGIDRSAASTALARSGPDGWLDATGAHDLLQAYGIPVSPQRIARTAAEAVEAADALGYPVVLKADGVVHKTDVGGVWLDLRTPAEVTAACEHLTRLATCVIVQPMAARGTELIVGALQDPTFGPLVMLGAGGVLADLGAARSFRLAPLTDVDSTSMLTALPPKLLAGFRGAPMVDRPKLICLLERVATMIEDCPTIVEVDLNPVLATKTGPLVVDAKIRAGAPVEFPDPLVRNLKEVAGPVTVEPRRTRTARSGRSSLSAGHPDTHI